MPDIRDTTKHADEALNEELKDTKWSQALPEMRWVARHVPGQLPGHEACIQVLQQRWRVWGANGDKDDERREWRDVPTVREG